MSSNALSLQVMFFILGAVFLLAGIAGGGLEIKEIKIPKLSGVVRILMAAIGTAFIVVSIYEPIFEETFLPRGVSKDSTHLPQIKQNGAATRILYEQDGPLHIGDESFASWPPLYGSCFIVDFVSAYEREKVEKLEISAATYGVENAILVLNEAFICHIPAQPLIPGSVRPNYWLFQKISIPASFIKYGNNRLKICSQAASNPEFRGDVDDFQVRDIKIIVHEKIANLEPIPVGSIGLRKVLRAKSLAAWTLPTGIGSKKDNKQNR